MRKINKTTLYQGLAIIIGLLIVFSVGAVIIGVILDTPLPPDDGFVVLDKRIETVTPYGWMWFLNYQSYEFKFANDSKAWLEVPDFCYLKYNVGDFYPDVWVVYH